jgi:hypothetical protein
MLYYPYHRNCQPHHGIAGLGSKQFVDSKKEPLPGRDGYQVSPHHATGGSRDSLSLRRLPNEPS